jgi:SAM-dependent methyltransferase
VDPHDWLTDDERRGVLAHLEKEYAGVFGPAEIKFHLDSHVGGGFADYACQVVAAATPAGSRLLDVGCGFGSFVVLARARGFDAVGTDIAAFDIAFARRRLSRLRPGDDPATAFFDGGIFNPDLQAGFDAITFWNVLEHIDDIAGVLRRAVQLLKPGGAIYVVCPSYCAWRNEAHYQIPWRPFLSKPAAVRRIVQHGKDPRFFESSVFLRSNWEVMRVLGGLGLRVYDRLNLIPMHPGVDLVRAALTRPALAADFCNPFRAAVELAARKPL